MAATLPGDQFVMIATRAPRPGATACRSDPSRDAGKPECQFGTALTASPRLDSLSLDALGSSAAACPGEADEKAIRACLLLCEDELEMRARGYIADGTYKIWADGMRGQLRLPMFGYLWHGAAAVSRCPSSARRRSRTDAAVAA